MNSEEGKKKTSEEWRRVNSLNDGLYPLGQFVHRRVDEGVPAQSLPPGQTEVRKLIRAFPAHSICRYVTYVTPGVHRIYELPVIRAACIEARGSSEARQP